MTHNLMIFSKSNNRVHRLAVVAIHDRFTRENKSGISPNLVIADVTRMSTFQKEQHPAAVPQITATQPAKMGSGA
jgi:hypothetical protein